jgi:hypothetical protein
VDFVWLLQQTAIIFVKRTNRSIFVTETQCLLSSPCLSLTSPLVELLQAVTSTVSPGSQSRETRDHILLFSIRGTPSWRTRSLCLFPPSDRTSQLYPQAPASRFIAFYDSRDYGGGIRIRLHCFLIKRTSRRILGAMLVFFPKQKLTSSTTFPFNCQSYSSLPAPHVFRISDVN